MFLGSHLGYNLAVNTAMHAAAAAASSAASPIGRQMPVSPVTGSTGTGSNQGNSQPGFPVRPSEQLSSQQHNSSPSCRLPQSSDGNSGNNRTDASPDTTTKDITNQESQPQLQHGMSHPNHYQSPGIGGQPSFLAFKAGEAPTTKSTKKSKKNKTKLVGAAPAAPQDAHGVQPAGVQPPIIIPTVPVPMPSESSQNMPENAKKTEIRHLPVVGTITMDPSDLAELKRMKIKQNLKPEAPECDCGPCEETGPYYTHLGVAPSLKQMRDIMEKRCGVQGSALRIEKAR